MTPAARWRAVCILCMLIAAGCHPLQTRDRSGSLSQTATEDTPLINSTSATEITYAFARSLEAKGELTSAEAIYEDLLDRPGDHGPVHHRLGLIAAGRYDYSEAAKCFEASLKIAADQPDVLCDLGYAEMIGGDLVSAQSRFDQALRYAPAHRRANNHLGLLLALRGEATGASQCFRRAGCDDDQVRDNLALARTLTTPNDP